MGVQRALSSIADKARERLDGALVNLLTGLGTGADPRLSTQINAPRSLDRGEIDSLVRGHWEARKYVEELPNEALRKWITLTVEGGPEDASKRILDKLEELEIRQRLTRALVYERQYGGSILLLGCSDSIDPSQPLNTGAGFQFTFVEPYSRFRVREPSISDLVSDPKNRRFGLPEYYYVRLLDGGNEVKVHHSRVIVFQGWAPEERERRSDWGVSVLDGFWPAMRDYESSLGYGLSIASRLIETRIKIPGLREMLTGPPALRDAAKQVMQEIHTARSVFRMLPHDANDEVTDAQLSFTGFADLIRIARENVAAASGLSLQRFFGLTREGLSDKDEGASERDDAAVAQYQRDRLLGPLNRLVEVAAASLGMRVQPSGDAGAGDALDADQDMEPEGEEGRGDAEEGGSISTWQVQFVPLREESPTVSAGRRLLEAQTAQIYRDLGALDENEIREGLRADPGNPYPMQDGELEEREAEPSEMDPEDPELEAEEAPDQEPKESNEEQPDSTLERDDQADEVDFISLWSAIDPVHSAMFEQHLTEQPYPETPDALFDVLVSVAPRALYREPEWEAYREGRIGARFEEYVLEEVFEKAWEAWDHLEDTRRTDRADAFNPDQPRDENGRWTSTGGAGSGKSKAGRARATQRAKSKVEGARASKADRLKEIKRQIAERQQEREAKKQERRQRLEDLAEKRVAEKTKTSEKKEGKREPEKKTEKTEKKEKPEKKSEKTEQEGNKDPKKREPVKKDRKAEREQKFREATERHEKQRREREQAERAERQRLLESGNRDDLLRLSESGTFAQRNQALAKLAKPEIEKVPEKTRERLFEKENGELGLEERSARSVASAALRADLRKIPEPVQQLIARSGARPVIADSVVEAVPELSGLRTFDGRPWDEVGGVYHSSSRRAVSTPGSASSGVMTHEMGHALDHAGGWYSGGRRFAELHEAAVTSGRLKKWASATYKPADYFSGFDNDGRAEAYAEIWAGLWRGGYYRDAVFTHLPEMAHHMISEVDRDAR